MLELTSFPYRFRVALPEGDYYEALGLSPKATKLDVDVAGARLAEQVPSMAADVSRVVNVLTHRERKATYDAVRKVRDEVIESLTARCGTEFSRTIPDFRRDLWERCSRLFRFDLTGDVQKLGEKGRQELVEAAPGWIVRDVFDAGMMKLDFTVSEQMSGRAGRDAWHAHCRCRGSTRVFLARRNQPASQNTEEDKPPEQYMADAYMRWPPKCPRCNHVYEPADFDGRYEFVLPAGLKRGDLIRGECGVGGGPAFVVFGSAPGPQSPKELLERFFALQNEGKDVTLQEAEKDLRKRPPAKPRTPAKPRATSKAGSSGNFPWWIIAVAASGLARACATQFDSPSNHVNSWTPPVKAPDFRSAPFAPDSGYDANLEPSKRELQQLITNEGSRPRDSAWPPIPAQQGTLPAPHPRDSGESPIPLPNLDSYESLDPRQSQLPLTLPLSPPPIRLELTLPDKDKPKSSGTSNGEDRGHP